MAHMAMADTHLPIHSFSSSVATHGRAVPTPPRMAPRSSAASASCPGSSLRGCGSSSTHGDALGSALPRRPSPAVLLPPHRGCVPRAPRRDVSAGSAQTRHFNTSFDPSKSNIPAEYNFAQPLSVPAIVSPSPSPSASPSSPSPKSQQQEAALLDVGPYAEFDPAEGHVADSYWRGPAPAGSFMIGNAIAQRTRLTPLRVPERGAGSVSNNPLAKLLNPLPREEYYAVEMELNYGREWPRFVWRDGTFAFRPGFLGPTIDPDFAPYWLHRGLARFEFSKMDRAVQTLIGGLYLAALAAASAALAALHPHLFAALAVSWARNSLHAAKWACLLFLAATDRLFLFWVFLGGKIVDGWLAKHAPPVRNFAWSNLALYGIYLALSPSDWTLLPGILT